MQTQTQGKDVVITQPEAARRKRRKAKSGRGKEIISKLSAGLMMPIAVLPLAGLLLGIGSAIPIDGQPDALIGFRNFIVNSGQFVFNNLAILFAVAIAIAFTRDAGVAALATVVAWACFNGMQNAMLFTESVDSTGAATSYSMLYWHNLPTAVFGDNIGINSLQTSVFGGMIVGAIVAFLYNKFYQIQLPKILGFFSGTRFVPIISLLAMMPLSIIFAMIWPGIGLLLSIIGTGLGTLGANGGANALIFGYVERALVPFGLHHAFYSPLWYTAAGGTMFSTVSAVSDMNSVTAAIWTYGSPWGMPGDNQVHLITAAGGQTFGDGGTTWINVLRALNPTADANAFSPDNWAGDQRLWNSINAYLAGKDVTLDNGETFRLTIQTFAQNTLNNFHPGVTRSLGIAWDPSTNAFAFPGVNPGQYQQGKYSFMVFGLPAASLAMVMAAPKENRATAGSIVISAGLTSFLTGITEPIEFTFLFLVPWLYWGVHAVYCAISFWLMSLLGMNMGMSFSGGLLDLAVYGFLPDALGKLANSYWAVVVGIVYMPIYFATFYFLIKKLDLKTPGRGGKLVTKKEYLASKTGATEGVATATTTAQGGLTPLQAKAYRLIGAYGGKDNLKAVNACITKLRVEVFDMSKVDREAIIAEGAPGVIQQSSSMIHAVFGTEAEPIKTQMNRILSGQLKVADSMQEAVVPVPVSVGVSAAAQAAPAHAPEPEAPQPVLREEIVVYAPLDGIVKSLDAVPDKTFSDRLMGDGVALLPTGGTLQSPSAEGAELTVAFPGGHAYVLTVAGAPILIHLGIDTVGINAAARDASEYKVFRPLVSQGASLPPFAALAEVDVDGIKSRKLNTITPVIAMSEALGHYRVALLAPEGSEIKVGEPLFKLVLKN